MKKYTIWIFLIIIGCEATNEDSNYFSKKIHYQYLLTTNEELEIPIETYKIRYKSDELEITGFINKPKNEESYPIIIFNRGGNRDFGVHNLKTIEYQQYLASKGYIVLSTQLRGNLFSEGADEMGGKDLNDILKLIEIGESLKFAEKDKIGVYGISRGGLNTYQISRLTDKIKAIAVIGAPTDPRLDFDTRPEMYTKVFKELIGDTINNREAYDYRSPLLWAKEINEPILIMHGREDWRVKPINAELMIEKLKDLGKEFEYHIIEGGDHGLNTHRKLRNEIVINWFDKYLKNE